MRQLVAYQFLPARKPAVVRRLLSRLPQPNAIAVLDLEDSAADAVCPERNVLLKANSRSNLDNLFDGSWQPPLPRLGLRINAAGTAEHRADLELAAAIQQRGYTIFLMLPKVEQAADVLDTARFFATRGLPSPPPPTSHHPPHTPPPAPPCWPRWRRARRSSSTATPFLASPSPRPRGSPAWTWRGAR